MDHPADPPSDPCDVVAGFRADPSDASAAMERLALLTRLVPGDAFELSHERGLVLSEPLAKRLDRRGDNARSASIWLWRLIERSDREALRRDLAMLDRTRAIVHRDIRLLSHRTLSLRAAASFETDGRLRRLVGTVEDVTRERRSARRRRREAETDYLTGLANRRTAHARLAERIRHADVRPFALGFVDLNHFKAVNDRYGHDTGDRLLKAVAERLSACVGQSEIVARLGGDEFMLLLDCDDATDLGARLATIRDQVQVPLKSSGDDPLMPSISIGAAWIDTARDGVHEVLAEADTAMYAAKERRDGTVVLFEDRMFEARRQQRALADALRAAVRDEAFEFWYQPIVSTRNPAYIGVEALMRWYDIDGMPLRADQFMPALEESRLIIDLTEIMLARLATDLEVWAVRGLLPDSIAFNLSPLQLANEDLLTICERFLTRIDPLSVQVIFEVTETAVIEDLDAARHVLSRLRQRGAKIALDDFGVGFSSLAVLHRLPVDILKLDGTFSTELFSSERSRNIVKAVLELAHTLSMPTVAERVETIEQATWLAGAGCTFLQGHHFSPALTARATESFVASRRPFVALRRAS